MIQADIVIVGRISSVDRPWHRMGRYTAVGQIEISEVLKGPDDLTNVELGWAEAGFFVPRMSNDDWWFDEGREGVWILSKSGDRYWCPTPGNIQPLESLEDVRGMLEAVNAIAAGVPDEGLALSMAFQVGDGQETGRDGLSLGTSLVSETGEAFLQAWITNVSDRPVLVPRAASGQLQIALTDEDGEPLDLGNGASDEGSIGSAVPELDSLQPGEHRFVGALPVRTEVPGELSITGVYAHDAGDGSSEPRTWSGSASRTLSFTVPAPRVPDEIAEVTLLPSYTLKPHLPSGGGDFVGVISAPGGLEIRYSVTPLPDGHTSADDFRDQIEIMQGVYADSPFDWIREETVAGEVVRLALTSEAYEQQFDGAERTLMAYYPSRGLNLSVSVENDAQIDEALSMILTVPGI
ncbi:MAG: hypothetical protein JRH01_21310 [Deltaproteobacteria bacterium]|nr:hypothetical protein [Deltaproteobacteria bacterium]MBW2395999.1 hypothetical protein [Deltaproteobacteria bacterium]